MTAEHRKNARRAIAAGLTAAVTDAVRVSRFQDPDIDVSPLVRVISGGSLRPKVISRGERTRFRIVVQTWVLYTPVSQGAESWTVEQAEDMLDDIEYAIASWVSANQNVPDQWTHLGYAEMSTTRPAEVDGVLWLIEDIPLLVEVAL